jgi:predicted tellurium resistance membrane protein TerC
MILVMLALRLRYSWYQLKDQLRPHKTIVYLAVIFMLFGSFASGIWFWQRQKKKRAHPINDCQ